MPPPYVQEHLRRDMRDVTFYIEKKLEELEMARYVGVIALRKFSAPRGKRSKKVNIIAGFGRKIDQKDYLTIKHVLQLAILEESIGRILGCRNRNI